MAGCTTLWSDLFIPCGPVLPLEMMTRQIKGDAPKQTLNGNQQPPPIPPRPSLLSPTPLVYTLNIWTLSFSHSCGPQPFPSHLHTLLQGKGSFPFYLCWAQRKRPAGLLLWFMCALLVLRWGSQALGDALGSQSKNRWGWSQHLCDRTTKRVFLVVARQFATPALIVHTHQHIFTWVSGEFVLSAPVQSEPLHQRRWSGQSSLFSSSKSPRCNQRPDLGLS